MSEISPFADAVQKVLEAVMFENWLRFYFITERPDEPDKLFLAIPDQGMKRIAEHYPQLKPMADTLNGKEIDFAASQRAICSFVMTELDGKRIPQQMSVTVFDSHTFQTEMHLFNTWVQIFEEHLDKGFLDFDTWKSLYARWRTSNEVKEAATRMMAAGIQTTAPSTTVQ